MKKIYGKHLTLLVKNVENIQNISNENEIKKFLLSLVDYIDMNVLVYPVAGYEKGDKHHEGYSGVIILCESHCAIHTYTGMKKIFIDIFSCKHYKTKKVIKFLKNYIGNFDIEEKKVLNRGVHWGKNIDKEAKKWKKQR